MSNDISMTLPVDGLDLQLTVTNPEHGDRQITLTQTRAGEEPEGIFRRTCSHQVPDPQEDRPVGRTLLVLEVLHRAGEDPTAVELEELAHESQHGSWSLRVVSSSTELLTQEAGSTALVVQGSDADFLTDEL